MYKNAKIEKNTKIKQVNQLEMDVSPWSIVYAPARG